MSSEILTLVGVILLLILASAFFSSAETALTAASDARMRQLAGKGNRRARLVERLRDDREGLIGSILIGNNAVNVIASALATSVFISVLDDAGVLWATITMTVILVVFAEVMPKTYALTYSDKYALAIAPAVRVVVIVLSPLSIALRMLASSLIRKQDTDEARSRRRTSRHDRASWRRRRCRRPRNAGHAVLGARPERDQRRTDHDAPRRGEDGRCR